MGISEIRGRVTRPAVAYNGRPGRVLPPWPAALAVIAHPDDESFGLGAVISQLAAAGTRVHVLCYSRGQASTLNETGVDLQQAREDELRQAATELGAAGVTLLDYPDGGLSAIPGEDLAGHVTEMAARTRPAGLLVFDDTGITRHSDHRAATAAAVLAARRAGLPVLVWVLPEAVADRLAAETGADFAGEPPGLVDLCVRGSRVRRRRVHSHHPRACTCCTSPRTAPRPGRC